MYSTTLYFLGRSLIYQKNIESAEKYFNQSKDLGKKLGLFTEVLSIRNGILIIKGDQADIEIKNRNYEAAKKDYRPNNYSPTTIMPKNDVHNVIDCNKRIIKLYTKLIEVTDDKTEQDKYLNAILKQLAGTGTSVGGLKLLIESDKVLPRIVADSYNSFGYLILKLYDKHIDFKQLKNLLTEKLNLTNGSDLEFIHQMFDKAKSLSRNTEFTKTDAYHGLIMVYERSILSKIITVEEKKQLSKKIKDLKKLSDELKNNI